MGLIKLAKFIEKQYFFIFINNCIRLIKMYIDTKKSDWLKYLKIYYNFYRTKSIEKHLIEYLQSDYNFEFQSYKANNWIQKERIIFKLSVPYFKEQNRVPEKIRRTIIDMTRATILLKGNIDNDL